MTAPRSSLLDQRIDIDALDDAIQVHPPEQAVQVYPVQHLTPS